ncbi:MAG: hypothetical protein OES47_05940 [Acidobacteriota bacterium]|nr:hypothetical protein [Acidobacteriota bacterium]
MNNENKGKPRRTVLENLKAYFGFAEPGLTGRERLRIFAENERRSWNRLMGSRRPEDACRRDSAPPAS